MCLLLVSVPIFAIEFVVFVIKGVGFVGLIGKIEFLVNAVGLGELSSGGMIIVWVY